MNPYVKNERMKIPLRILNLRPLLAGVRVAFHPSGHRLYSLDTMGEVKAWPIGAPRTEQ
jgi:hypothetical protein